MGPPERTHGRVIAHRFQLVSELGRGGMASVWRAEHLALRSQVAIKLLDPAIGEDPEMVERFLREAQAAASLRSRHVVQIFDYGVDEGVPFIAMELLDGESLRERLERRGRLSPGETARILSQVARAVDKAHEAGIVHRDLKPDNIFLVREEDETAKVLDFGIAKIEKGRSGDLESLSTLTGRVLGTPFYMSPEQARGDRTIDYRSDLWALAVIAFECLTGERPFEGHGLGDIIVKICSEAVPVPSTRSAVPDGFDFWFAQGVERDPNRRFQSARELSDALWGLVGTSSPSGAISPPVLTPELTTARTLVSKIPPAFETLTERSATFDIPMRSAGRRSWWVLAAVIGLALAIGFSVAHSRRDATLTTRTTPREEPRKGATATVPASGAGWEAPPPPAIGPSIAANDETPSSSAAPIASATPDGPEAATSGRVASKSRRNHTTNGASTAPAPSASAVPRANHDSSPHRAGWETFSDRE